MDYYKKRFSRLDGLIFILIIISIVPMMKNVLIFHTLMEVFSVIVAMSLAVIALNSINRSVDNKIIFIGISYLFIGILDIFHTLSYPGIPLFNKSGANLASQFWIVARFIEAISILLVFKMKKMKSYSTLHIKVIGILTMVFIYIILMTDLFPKTFIEGAGLTRFKVISEYIIIVILFASLMLARKNKNQFIGYSYDYFIFAIIFTILSEIAFTLYQDIYGMTLSLGHALKVLSFYMIYKGLVVVAVNEPYERIEDERTRFFEMFDKAKDAVFLLKIDKENKLEIINANEKACELLKISKEEIKTYNFEDFIEEKNKNATFLELFKREKSAFFFEVLISNIKSETIKVDINMHTIEVFDEKIKWINIRDISIRKSFEKESSMYKKVFENALESIVVTNSQNKIKWINKNYENTFGYALKEVKGKNPSILKSGKQDENFYKSMWKEINEKGYWKGEIWNKRKDGSIVPMYQSISKIKEVDESYYFSVMIDLTEKKKDEVKMFELAYTDLKTKLKNYNYIEDKMKFAKIKNVILLEINNLNKIKLKYGKEIAEKVLIEIVRNIKALKFEIDLYSLDSNQILILIDKSEEQFCEKLLKVLNDNFIYNEMKIEINYCIAKVKSDKKNIDFISDMIRKAQLTIAYNDKNLNMNCIDYTKEIEEMILENESLVEELKKAVKNEDFEVYYQPIVNQYSGEIFGAESLARWNHKERGFIPPEKFIDMAEKNNLIIKLGKFILMEACKTFKKCLNINKNISLTVNVSILQFQDTKFISYVKDVLEKTQFPPSNLILEVTEGIAIDNFEIVKTVMVELGKLNIRFALDDFGMGFSSMSKLKQLPVSYIKIERSFIVDINENLQNSLLVSAMISMAYHLGLDVIVEGIEELNQIRVIKNNNCKLIQGYYYSKPVEFEKFEEILKMGFEPISLKEEISENELEKIENEKNRFKMIHKSKPMGFQVLNSEGMILEMNHELASMLGYTQNELIGRNFFEMIDEDEEILKNCVNKVIEKGGIRDLHKKIKTKNRNKIDVLINNYIDYDENKEAKKINCLIQDISENIEKEKKLVRMREVYRKVFNEAPVAFILWNKNYSITEWNQHSEEIFGWKRKEILGQKLNTIILKENFLEWKLDTNKILSGIPVHKFMGNIVKQGKNIICEWFNEPIYNDFGEVEFVLSIVRDVTEKKKKEQEIDKMRDMMINQKRMVEIGQLMAGITNEIKNPLSYILSNTEALNEDIKMYLNYMSEFKNYAEINGYPFNKESYDEINYLEKDIGEIIGSFKDGLEKIKNITESLKVYSKIEETGSFEFYNVNENINKIVMLAHHELKYSTELKLELREKEITISAIKNQINQVLLALLINSKDLISKKFENQIGKIIVKTWMKKNKAYISIENNGLEINEDTINKIFQPMFKSNLKDSDAGFIIIKEIIENTHGGKFIIENKPNIGSKFTIELPVNKKLNSKKITL